MFEIARLEKVFTFQNVLLHEIIQVNPKSNFTCESFTDYLRAKIGTIATKEDLVAMRYVLSFEEYQGIIPPLAKQHVRDTHSYFVLLLWDILKGNEYNYEHPLARVARNFLAEYKQHLGRLAALESHVSTMRENVSGVVQVNELGNFELEEQLRAHGIVINGTVFFPCLRAPSNFSFRSNQQGTTLQGGILIQKDNKPSAAIIMDFS